MENQPAVDEPLKQLQAQDPDFTIEMLQATLYYQNQADLDHLLWLAIGRLAAMIYRR